MTIQLRHVSASGDLAGNMWTYDPHRRLVVVVYQHAGFDVPVCSERHPRIGAYAIRRLDETTFRIAPSQFDKPRTQWASHAALYEEGIPPEFIELTGAPADVALELGELF